MTAAFLALALQARPIALGDAIPEDLTVTTLEGETKTLRSFQEPAEPGEERPILIVTSWSMRCPIGQGSQRRYAELATWAGEHGAKVVAICSYGDTADEVGEITTDSRLAYPILMDTSTRAARRLGTGTVTTTLVFDREGRLRYRGGIDNQRRGGQFVAFPENAATALADGRAVEQAETRAYG